MPVRWDDGWCGCSRSSSKYHVHISDEQVNCIVVRYNFARYRYFGQEWYSEYIDVDLRDGFRHNDDDIAARGVLQASPE